MLIEFRVANFRSFEEEQTISLVASKDEKHPDNMIPCEKSNLLKAAAIYGSNASGKSNLVKAIGVARQFVRNSATRMNVGDKIRGIVPFRLDADSRMKPSSFEMTVVVDGTRFNYSFSATSDRVHDERLVAYAPRAQRWFERRFDLETKQTVWAFRGPLRAEERILKEKTRDNGLVLSRGAELNIKPLSELFLWFRRLWVFDLSDQPVGLIMMETAKRIKEDPVFANRVIQMTRHADLGIDAVTVAEESFRAEEFPTEMKALLSEKAMHEVLTTRLVVHTTHRILHSNAQVEFDLGEDESNGTKRFFSLAGPILDALDNGAVVVVDELDCSLHPLLTRKLIELFQSPEANKKGAQLIFVTHDSTLMDPELFRRDQIWMVEKNSSGASELFSLYDFDTKDRPRNTEAFQRNYLAGRYGGVPKFGPIFENLETK